MMRAIILALFAAASVSAQISGTITDPSRSLVAGARVTATRRSSSNQATTIADANGSYLFKGLSPGEWLVDARAPGFGSSAPQLVILSVEGAPNVDLTLQLQRVTTQVQVTAAGGAQTVDEQAKALSVIDSQQIADRAEFSVAEAIRSVPGIRVQQVGGPGSLVRVMTRGMRPMDTAILIDGFRFRDAASPQGEASAFLGDLLLVNTDRIEVLRGSGSSLYGTHATAGLINLITASAEPGFHTDFGAEGGGLGLARGYGKVAGSLIDSRLRFSVGATHLNVAEGIDGNDSARNSLAHGMIAYRLGESTELMGRIMTNDSFAQLNSTPFLDAASNLVPSPDDPDSRRDAGYFSGLLGVSHDWSAGASSRFSYQAVTTRRDNRNGPAGVEFQPSSDSLDRFEGRLDTLQARTDLRLGRNAITVGYEWEREKFDSLSLPADAQLRINQRSHAAFAQDQLQLLDRRLQVSLSGRLQGFQLEQPTFSDDTSLYRGVKLESPPRAITGDVAIAYFAQRTGTKLRAHLGNGYRGPALFERFGGSYFGGFSVYGDPRLRPERLLALDAGFDQYVGTRSKISATYFYTRIQEAIAFDFSGLINPATDPFGRFGGYRNTGGGLARGLELSLEANPVRSLTLRSAYTYTNSDERQSIFPNGSLRSVRVSDHMFTATATQRIGRSIDFTFDLFAASDYIMSLSSRPFVLDGPLKADISASYSRALTDRARLQFFTRVDNVLNRTYYEDGFRTPRAWATAGLKFLF